MNDTMPLVSISCTTFNHAPYLRVCLDGFIMQKTTFSFEVVIHDDCSTDGTKAIIEEYSTNYPAIFFPLIQKENQYSKGVRGMMAQFNFSRCRGKYIALCEGDDYWTDPYKLQKQVDFLEANQGYAMCFHNATYLYSDGDKKKFSEKFPFLTLKNDFTRGDLLKSQWFIPTASMVFKKIEVIPDYFLKVYAGDFNLQLYLSQLGKFYYFPENMSVYRITEKGLGTVNKNPNYRIHDLTIWKKLVKSSEKTYILRWLLGNYKLILILNLKNKKYSCFINDMINFFKTSFLYGYYSIFYF